MDKPYREQTVEIEYVCPELIIVHNPACDIVFKWRVYILRENLNQTVNGTVNHWKVKQDYMQMNTIHGTKDIGKVVKDSFTSKRMYKYT